MRTEPRGYVEPRTPSQRLRPLLDALKRCEGADVEMNAATVDHWLTELERATAGIELLEAENDLLARENNELAWSLRADPAERDLETRTMAELTRPGTNVVAFVRERPFEC